MKYNVYKMTVSIDGILKQFDVVAIDKDSALADIKESYCGNVKLITFGIGD